MAYVHDMLTAVIQFTCFHSYQVDPFIQWWNHERWKYDR